ncbi:MAG: TIGR02710 family CRISPR-associated CARF protein [Candidatus Bathyarchaeia archaeon]
MKALIISVGTGTRRDMNAAEDLATALAQSVRHHNPDVTLFVVTCESRERTLPIVIDRAKPKQYEVIMLEDPDNIQAIYETLQPIFVQARESYEHLVVDFTSGTKAMTASLAVLAALYDVNELSYITGKRMNGIVQAGTEQILSIRPYFISAEQKLKTAIYFFNRAQYSTATAILRQIIRIKDPKIIEKVDPILNLAEAYALWDKFKHIEAFEKLKNIKISDLNKNKQFLGELASRIGQNREPEPYFIADLLNNAQRRAEEGKHDDAVARLYRTMELIAQYRLKIKYGIESSSCPSGMLPPKILEKWNIPPGTGKVKLGLEKDYELLEAKGDILGEKYLKDESLRHLLLNRNNSILAHGLTPVEMQVWQKLHEKVLEYAKIAVKNLDCLIEMSRFLKLKE